MVPVPEHRHAVRKALIIQLAPAIALLDVVFAVLQVLGLQHPPRSLAAAALDGAQHDERIGMRFGVGGAVVGLDRWRWIQQVECELRAHDRGDDGVDRRASLAAHERISVRVTHRTPTGSVRDRVGRKHRTRRLRAPGGRAARSTSRDRCRAGSPCPAS